MIIALFYLDDLFENLFVIPLVGNCFQHKNTTSPARAEIMINPEFMYIATISNNSLSCAI